MLSFTPAANLDFPLCALFRLEPYIGRFPETANAKEKVVKGQYGRPVKPGARCSLRHVMTRMYLGKREREREDACRACLLRDVQGQLEEKLPDMAVTVVSEEAWKDEGILDGSQVFLTIQSHNHRYHLDLAHPTNSADAVFRFSPSIHVPISIHSFLPYSPINNNSAKYGFICQVKTNSGMYLTVVPNYKNGARLKLTDPEARESVFPEYWGRLAVELSTDEGDGNAYWVIEALTSAFTGGIILGGSHFLLKNVFARRYIGPDFELVDREKAQVFTFPYTAAHTSDRLNTSESIKDSEGVDVVETYEQYPLLGVERQGGTMVGRSYSDSKEDMWGALFRQAAWRLKPGTAVHQKLIYVQASTPDKLLRFEVRETDLRTAQKILEIVTRMRRFVTFHRFLENPDENPMVLEDGQRRSITSMRSVSSLKIGDSALGGGETSEEEVYSSSEMPGLESLPGTQFSLSAEAVYEIKQLKALITRVKKRKELKFLIDAQVFTEILRLSVFMLSGESHILPEVMSLLRPSFSNYLFKAKDVWVSLYANGDLVEFIAEKYRKEWIEVVKASVQYQKLGRDESVMVGSKMRRWESSDLEVQELIESIQPDSCLQPAPSHRTLTELMTTHLAEAEDESFQQGFIDAVKELTLAEQEVIREVEYWNNLKDGYNNLRGSAEHVNWLTSKIDQRQISGGTLQRIMVPILELLDLLVDMTIKESECRKEFAQTADVTMHYDLAEVKQFVQSVFQLLITFQSWVDYYGLKYYRENQPMRYSDLAIYMQRHLTLGNLELDTMSKSLAVGLLGKKKVGLKEPLIEKKLVPLVASPGMISIPKLLLKIAKQTRYRVQDHPSALLKLIDKAINPAQSVAQYVHILTLKESFPVLFRKVRELLLHLRFYVDYTEEGYRVQPPSQLEEYVRELESLKQYLDSMTGEPEIVGSMLQCLAYAGFEQELERLWSCCALLPLSLPGVSRLRELACSLARIYAAGSPKRMKHVFLLLSSKTFFIEEPEYIRLLLELKLVPRDDDLLKPLVALIAHLTLKDNELTPAGSESLQLLNDSFSIMPLLREVVPQASELTYSFISYTRSIRRPSMEEHVKQLRSGFQRQQELLTAFQYKESMRPCIGELLTQAEMMSTRLHKTLKTVFLTDNLVKEYLQTWRHVILTHHSLMRLSSALAGVKKLPGIPAHGRMERYTTFQAMHDPAREVQEVLKLFTESEITTFNSRELDLPTPKDILQMSKHWRGRMENLIERIIDYICRSSNRSLQKEDVEVLAEVVRDDPASKLQVIAVLGRCRQYRYFFGLFEDCVHRLEGDNHEKKEIEELVSAFLKLFQAACDGCFSPFQNYMRVQNEGQHDNVNLVHVLAQFLEVQLVEPAKLNVQLATDTACALLEACSGPCIQNIAIVCHYQRMLREIAKFVQMTLTGSELLKKVDSLASIERDKARFSSSPSLHLPGLDSFIKKNVPPQQQQTVLSEPRLVAIMGKLYLKESKKTVNLNARCDGVNYPGLNPKDLALCTQLVNMLIALLEGSQKRPEKISELMPAVKFTHFEKMSKWLLDGVKPDFFTKFEKGTFLLNDTKVIDNYASPGAVLTFALRCFILYYTSLSEEELPNSGNPLRKYIGCVEVQQSDGQLNSVVFPVPFKALHLSWMDTEHIIKDLASSSREENLKSFVSQLDIYIGEMKFLQGLTHSRLRNFMRFKWKQLFWLAYVSLLVVNTTLLLAFDDWEQVGYAVSWPYCILVPLFGGLHSFLRLLGTYAFYLRFSYLIWHPLGISEGASLLSTLAHTEKPGTVEAYYSSEPSRTMIDVRNTGLIRAGLSCLLIPISLLALVRPWIYPFLLLEVCVMEPTLVNIIKALTNRCYQLLLTFTFALLLMFIYTILGFFFIREQFAERPCETMLECFVDMIYYGMRLDEGIAGALEPPSNGEMTVRFIYDMSFYILISTILMAIIFGLVVDTFGELRDEMSEAERNLTSNCVICHQPRSSIETTGEGWATHVFLTHNPFAYLYFMTYVKEKDVNDCSGVEKFVRAQIDLRDIGFFPTAFRGADTLD